MKNKPLYRQSGQQLAHISQVSAALPSLTCERLGIAHPFSILKHSMFIGTPCQCPFHNCTHVVAPLKLLHHPVDVKVVHHRQRERNELQIRLEARVQQCEVI